MFTFVLFDNIKTCNLNCIGIGQVKLNILLEASGIGPQNLVSVHHYFLQGVTGAQVLLSKCVFYVK